MNSGYRGEGDIAIWIAIALIFMVGLGMCGEGNPYDCEDKDPTQYSDC